MTAQTKSIVLCGGPRNGEVLAVARYRNVFPVPLPREEIEITMLGDTFGRVAPGPMRLGFYEPRYIASTGHQCFDAVYGNAIYDWAGEAEVPG